MAGIGIAWPSCALFNELLAAVTADDVLDIHTRSHHQIRVDLTAAKQVLHLRNGHPAGCCAQRVEVLRGPAIDKVAVDIAVVGVHQANVGNDATLLHVGLSVEVGVGLALCNERADAGCGVERGNTCATCAKTLCQSSLRVNSTSISPSRYWRANSLFSPT